MRNAGAQTRPHGLHSDSLHHLRSFVRPEGESDFLTKSGTMYIGERLFNKSQAGRSEGGGDNVMRSVVKAIIWRLFAACNTLVASALIMKSRSSSGVAGAAAKIAGVDSVVKTALMVAYDQAWNKVEWGREYEQVNVGGEGI